MPVALLLKPLLTALASKGLGLLAGAIEAKGKEVIEDKLGVKIPEDPANLTPELLQKLQIRQMEHEEFLVNARVREKELDLQADAEGQKQVTERWKADMTSDSYFSKNIRPMTLAWWTIAITILIVLDSALSSFNVEQKWIDLIEVSYGIVLAAYFVGRTVQHVGKMWQTKEK